MTQRSVLITGCSSGIGLASAMATKARGWRVFATARKPVDLARLTALKEQCRRHGGAFTLLWHNSFLLRREQRALYEAALDA